MQGQAYGYIVLGCVVLTIIWLIFGADAFRW